MSSTRADIESAVNPSYEVQPQPTQAHNEPIAIVGIGCKTPGADNTREFWRVLINGENHVTDVPADRWNSKAFLDLNQAALGKAYVQKGGFLKNPAEFDNGLYGINDLEASQMDPQQSLLLECTSMALEDAGIPYDVLSGSSTGVFIGSMNSDFKSTFAGMNSTVDSYTVSGTSSAVLAGRLSYVFNLFGPSMVIDTACSSSLVAIHQACLAIRNGDCDQAVCGGVNVMISPEMFSQLSKAKMISPTGQCHAFSDKADGYTRGEGCGVVILKRLDDALRDGDKIWATVCTGTNQDGRTVSPMAAPSGEQQKKLLYSVYDKFQVDVSQLDYIEAHGTGTAAGDPVEVNALGSFFNERGEPRDRYIGSLKTNIGHTESSAGILSVIKVCLMMKHNVIVPSLHCQVVNPKIDLSQLRFIIPQPGNLIPWDRPDKLAGCSSYGFSGSNCHAVLKSVPKTERVAEKAQIDSCIVCFSAKSLKSLKDSLTDFVTDEDSLQDLRVQDVSYTSTVRRHHYPYRAVFLAQNMQQLKTAVREQLSHTQWPQPAQKHPDVVFVFCGMSTAWDRMCRELLAELPVFKNAVTEVDKLLRNYVSWSLKERLEKENASSDLLLSPIAIFACQVGLAAVWQSLDIKPVCVVGQSIGEVAAAYIAGCLSLADAVRVIYHRSKLLSEVSGGSMVLVQGVEVDEVRRTLTEYGANYQATIALEYSSTSCAVSAASDAMPSIKHFLKSKLSGDPEAMRLRDLDVSVAYHSPHVSPCADKLSGLLEDLDCHHPTVPMQSSVTGNLLETPPNAQYWADNVRSPVLFHQAVTGAASHCTAPTTVFLEIGPHPVLKAHLKDIFPGQTVLAITSMMKSNTANETKTLNMALVALYENGAQINWKAMPAEDRQITDVPRYVFDRKVNEKKPEMRLMLTNGVNVYQKNHLYTCAIHDQPETFQVMISPLVAPTVYQHKLSGKILVPGAYMVEASLAVGHYLQMARPAVSITFNYPVWLHNDEVTYLAAQFQHTQSELRPLVFLKGSVSVASAHLLENHQMPPPRVNVEHIRAKCGRKVEKDEIYSALRKRGLEYGPDYSLIQQAYKGSGECLASLTVTENVRREMSATVFHPSLLDNVFQTTVPAIPDDGPSDENLLPKSIGRLVVHNPVESSMYVHTRLKESDAKKFVFDMQVISRTGLVIAEIRDFVLLALQSLTEEIMLTTVWRKVSDTGSLSFRDTNARPLVFVTNSKDFQFSPSDIVFEGGADWQDASERLRNTVNETCVPSAVVFVCATDMDDSADSDDIHNQLVAMCCLVKDILQRLKDVSSNIAFYLCTFNAWPAVGEETDTKSTNPAATALWGLLRTINMEKIYPHVSAVELHQASNSSSESLPYLFSHLIQSETLKNYPEVLITDDEILVNLVEKDESTPVDIERHREVLKNKRYQNSEYQTSGTFYDAADTQIIADTQRDMARIKIDAFALSTTEEKTDMECTQEHIAAEIKGRLLEQEAEVASCYPVIVKPEVCVPTQTVVPTSIIPDYQLGDVSNLVILWELCRLVRSPDVTILASAATVHLVKLIKLMCCSQASTENINPVVKVVLLEDLDTVGGFSDTVISLLLLDTALVTSMCQKLAKSKCFITLSSLTQSKALSLLTCLMAPADVEVVELNYKLLFQPKTLTRTIPQILSWIKDNQSNITEIVKALHHGASKATSTDLNSLLLYANPEAVIEMKAHATEALFKKNAAYLVVGGLTGLGWVCVEFLARENAGHIAIFNRRAPTDERAAAIEQLSRQYNCQIRAFQADVTSRENLKQLLEEISAGKEIRGVFMGAAVTDDMPFLSMTKEAFDRALSAKVKGAWNLHQLLCTVDLDYFVLHSSLASLLGNPGQANYSAANAFLDGLAIYRRQRGLVAQSINWGPLDMGLLENMDSIKAKLESEGYPIASRQDVLDMLYVVLSLKATQCVPAKIDVKLFARRMLSSEVKPLLRFQQFASFNDVSIPSDGTSQSPDMSVQKMKALDPESRIHAYEVFFLNVIGHMQMVDPSQVSRDQTIQDLGMDSVLITMMLDIIERNTNLRISPVEVLAGDITIASLACKLSELADASP